jgi:hypothetical protein
MIDTMECCVSLYHSNLSFIQTSAIERCDDDGVDDELVFRCLFLRFLLRKGNTSVVRRLRIKKDINSQIRKCNSKPTWSIKKQFQTTKNNRVERMFSSLNIYNQTFIHSAGKSINSIVSEQK